MKLSVYVPKELEGQLREQAEGQSMTPSLFVQERFEQGSRRFTPTFATLAGSWEDERSAGEICRELEESRQERGR